MCAASRSCGFWCIRTASSTTSGPWAWLPSSPAHAGFDLVRILDQAENRRVVDKTLDRLELLVGHITFDLNLCGDVRDASVGLGPLDLEQHAGIDVARDLDLNPFQFDFMPGSIESYGRGHTRGESAKRHFHRLSTITRSHKPYRFFDFSPAAIRDCVVTRQALYSLVTESIGCDVNGAAPRMPLPNAHGLQPKRDGSVFQRFPKRFELLEVHAVDDGVAHDSGS